MILGFRKWGVRVDGAMGDMMVRANPPPGAHSSRSICFSALRGFAACDSIRARHTFIFECKHKYGAMHIHVSFSCMILTLNFDFGYRYRCIVT